MHEIGPQGPTKGNAQLIRENDFSFTKVKLVYCLTRKKLNCNSFVSPGTPLKLEQIHNLLWVWCTSGKMMISYVSSIKMEEHMELELPGIFWVKMVAKNIVLGSPGTHFFTYEG